MLSKSSCEWGEGERRDSGVGAWRLEQTSWCLVRCESTLEDIYEGSGYFGSGFTREGRHHLSVWHHSPLRARRATVTPLPAKPSSGVYFWPYPVFEVVRYGKLQRDTARYSWIQLDTYGYSWIQWETAGYSGSAAKWLDKDRYSYTGIQRDTKQVKLQAGYAENTRQGRAPPVQTI